MLLYPLLTALTAGSLFLCPILANPVGHTPSSLLSRRGSSWLSSSASSSTPKREIPSTHVLHERHVPHLARRWAKRDKLAPGITMPMRIGLTQPEHRLADGHARLLAMTDPASPHHGKHMTPAEVIEFFAPPAEAVDAVIEWLVGSGIARERFGLSANKQWIQFDAQVAEVENLLMADFFVWEHEEGHEDVATETYHVPADVAPHIDYITPGTRLRPTGGKKLRQKRGVAEPRNIYSHAKATVVGPDASGQAAPFEINGTSCATYIVAECLRHQYGIPNGTTNATGNELGIFESLDDHYSRADLDVFFSTLYPYIPNGTYPTEELIDGAVGAIEDPSPITITAGVGLESSLDFDTSIPLIWPQSTILFQTDDEYYESTGNFTGFWNTFLDALDGSYCSYTAYNETGDCVTDDCADPVYPDPNPGGYTGALQCGVYEPTNVISVSYGAWGYPDNYVKRQCNELMKLGLQGTTVVVSSGDSGVGEDYYCADGPDGLIFYTTMMSECPYVLSVGSTELDTPANATSTTAPYPQLTEIATARFASGGGFSNVFAAPDWQADAIDTYLAQVSLPFGSYDHLVNNSDFSSVTSGVFNRGGRAYPDIAAVGDRQVVYAGGLWYRVGGTSLSAPVVASMVTLANEARIAAGKGPVGWFTDKLYSHPELFTDITDGSNPGCDSTGFVNAPGWDPVSGWGSPIYPEFATFLESL